MSTWIGRASRAPAALVSDLVFNDGVWSDADYARCFGLEAVALVVERPQRDPGE